MRLRKKVIRILACNTEPHVVSRSGRLGTTRLILVTGFKRYLKTAQRSYMKSNRRPLSVFVRIVCLLALPHEPCFVNMRSLDDRSLSCSVQARALTGSVLGE